MPKQFPDGLKCPLQFFSPDEFKHPEKMDVELLQLLDFTREDAGTPFYITSDYRDPEHNERIGGSPYSLHIQGNAVDFVTNGCRARDKRLYQKELYQIVYALMRNVERMLVRDLEMRAGVGGAQDARVESMYRDDRKLQLELVQGEDDWHVHLGLYPRGDIHPPRLILALD
jgi:hypothetical protein